MCIRLIIIIIIIIIIVIIITMKPRNNILAMFLENLSCSINTSKFVLQSLSKNDDGTFTCHAGNGYGNNATKNIIFSVNRKCLILIFDLKTLIKSERFQDQTLKHYRLRHI
jgi:hypothetical protein